MVLALINRKLNLKSLVSTMDQTVKLTSMVFIHPHSATAFSMVFTALRGRPIVQDFLLNLPGGHIGFIFFTMLVIFLLGFFIDFIEITFIVVPLLVPIARTFFGLDGMLWFGVLVAMNLQASFLTPPFGSRSSISRGGAPRGEDDRYLPGHHPVRYHPGPGSADHRAAPGDCELPARLSQELSLKKRRVPLSNIGELQTASTRL